jgi:ABC-type dipeptide/oligopeptide/nickel transport system ATPase component
LGDNNVAVPEGETDFVVTISNLSASTDYTIRAFAMNNEGIVGYGKTTVIRAIMGCLPGAGRVSRGSITFDGKDVLQNTPEEWRKMYGSEMSMIFQDSGNMINPIRRIGQQFIDYVQERQVGEACTCTRPTRSRLSGCP